MYDPLLQNTEAEMLECLQYQDPALRQWWDQLPPHLKIDPLALPALAPPSHIVTMKCVYLPNNIVIGANTDSLPIVLSIIPSESYFSDPCYLAKCMRRMKDRTQCRIIWSNASPQPHPFLLSSTSFAVLSPLIIAFYPFHTVCTLQQLYSSCRCRHLPRTNKHFENWAFVSRPCTRPNLLIQVTTPSPAPGNPPVSPRVLINQS